jgi:GH25 family lysozyme M1 (1,4-beta-N-acetylmuramidase)
MIQPAQLSSTDPLIVDVYSGDGITQEKLTELATAGRPWCGAICKASEGLRADRGFAATWPAIRAAGGPRYGIDWFRGAYHFLRFDVDAMSQAASYLELVGAAGGWDVGDLWPIVDVERGQISARVTRTQVELAVRTFAIHVTRETGRAPMMYAGSFLRDLGITDHLGCQLLWTARYAADLPARTYESIGWTRARLWGWQYRGVPAAPTDAAPATYPTTTPIGDLDISAIVIDDDNGHEAPIAWTRTHNGSNPL